MSASDVHQARKARPQRRHGRLLRFLILLLYVDDVAARQLGDDAEEIVVAELSRLIPVDVVEEEEEAEEASVAALRARLSCLVDVARAHGLAT